MILGDSHHNKCTLKNGKKAAFDICAKGLIIDWRKKMKSIFENMNKHSFPLNQKALKEIIDKLIAFVEKGAKEEKFALRKLRITSIGI